MVRPKCKQAVRKTRSSSSRRCRSKKRRTRSRSKSLKKSQSCAPTNSADQRRKKRKDSCAQLKGKPKSLLATRKSKRRVKTGSDDEDSDDEAEAPPESEILPPPLISPRDPNFYRLIKLENGLKAMLVSTCGLAIEDAKEASTDEAAAKAAGCSTKTPATSVFNRRRGKRDRRAKGDDKGKRNRYGRGYRDYDEKNENNPGCVDEDVQKFNEKVRKGSVKEEQPKGKWREGSIMEAMLGFEPAEKLESDEDSDEKPVADDEDSDDEDLMTNLEPTDKTLLKSACGRMQQTNECMYIVLTIGCGSINDPPDLRGLALLTSNAVVNEAMRSREYFGHDSVVLTRTSFCALAYSDTHLRKALNLLADKVLEVEIRKDEVMETIDQLERYIENNQCVGCWTRPSGDHRIQAILLSFATEHSPISRMTHMGFPPELWAAATAKNDLEKQIRDFMNLYYIGNSMTLAVQAPLPLDEMEEMVTKAFSKIPTGEPPEVVATDQESLFDSDKFQKFYDVPCSNSKCRDSGDGFVLISWALSPDFWKDKTSKPIDYIISLMKDKSPNGLIHHLKALNWISTLTMTNGSEFHQNPYYTMLQIQVKLTEAGLHNIDELIESIFAYLKYLKARGPRKFVYHEMQKTASLDFHALPHEISFGSHSSYGIPPELLSEWLQHSDSQNLIIEQYLYTKYDATQIRKVLDLLVPETANFMLLSCSHVERDDMTLVEPIYHTRYGIRDVPAEVMQRWSSPTLTFAFALPVPNLFLPGDFCLEQDDNAKTGKEPILYTPENESNARIWYQFDRKFNHFKLYYIHFLSPESFESPENAVMLQIWSIILQDMLSPVLYPAKMAGIEYDIEATPYGIMVTLYSWNQKIEEVLRLIINELAYVGTNVDPEIFERKKKILLVHLSYQCKEQQYTEDIYNAVTIIDDWPTNTLFNELKSLKMRDFLEFTRAFGENGTFVALLKGNVFERTARYLDSVITTRWPSLGTASLQDFPVKMNQIPLGERVIKTVSLSNYVYGSYYSHVQHFYQLGPLCIEDRALAEVVVEMLCCTALDLMVKMFEERWARKKARRAKGEEPVDDYDDLWVLYPTLITEQGVLTISINSFGSARSFSNDDLEQKLNCFLDKFDLCVWEGKSNSKRFKALKRDVKLKFEPDPNDFEIGQERFPRNFYFSYFMRMRQRDNSYNVIKDLSFRFNEYSCLASEIDSIRPEDVRKFFNDYLTHDGKNYRMLSIQLHPPKSESSKPKPGSSRLTPPKTKTVQQWRRRRTKIRDCSPDAHGRLLGTMKAYDPNEELELKFLGDPEGKCDERIVTDLFSFRLSLYEYPDDMC